MFGLCFALQSLVSILVLQLYAREERADCFILIVFLLSCDCKWFMFLTHIVVGWSVIVVFS